ncbi:exo-alpha-sialidase [Sphingobacterium sp. SGG-5]|nr:exo-alpha-sialidase [Sphingobacterium sp. SGG-5]
MNCRAAHSVKSDSININGVSGSVVAYSPASTGIYLGSPSLAILPNGDYVASHDTFGPESSEWVQAVSRIYRSTDKGANWTQIAEISGAFWSKLFVHHGTLYFLGPDRHHGTLLIRKSLNGGETWTRPTNKQNGLLLDGLYHCAPMPVIEHNGRLWRAMETAHGPILQWGKRYGAMMMSVPVDADLLKAKSWTCSNSLLYDSTYLNGHFNGWLEGNAVVGPHGNIVNVLRVDDRTTFEEKAAIVSVSEDGKTATFDDDIGFIPFPGGSKKFVIRYDSATKLYWTLTNYIPDSLKQQLYQQSPKLRSSRVRNTLALCSSSDLIDWTVNKIALQDTSVAKHGFQYVDWQFEGDDIIFLSRTAYKDDMGGANNCHDSNFITFHRILKFRAFKDSDALHAGNRANQK